MAMDKRTLLAVGGIASGFVASLCCVGPLVFAVAGMGVFGAATFFSNLRPYFLTAAGMLLAAGFYFTFRSHKVVCEDGSCKTVSTGRRSKALLLLTAMLTLLFGLSPYFTAFFLPRTSKTKVTISRPSASSLQTISFHVKGMTCGGCAANVRAAITGVPGVKTAVVDLGTETATVVFDPARTDRDMIAEAVKKGGYTPVL